ncbi:MAG TPA: malto-oligosyltrehalose trehalohydrolase [Nitrospirota bacterium]
MIAGTRHSGNGRWKFSVWAPFRKSVELKIISPGMPMIPMRRDDRGYWHAEVNDLVPDARYFYRLDGERDRPDPASRFQPEGVHGPSQLVDLSAFIWEDHDWKGIALPDFVIYELHVGVFTSAGTFDAVIPRLDYLKELGISAVELMPVAQFPGTRNWGYDGAYPFAVQNSYGGPGGLMRLVNACHRKGLAVILDVVYNHLGPEGNYLRDYGPYFAGRYKTPWGDAINFDGPHSDEVRSYFIGSALAWVKDFHIDALRIDAIHEIYDFSAKHFLRELGESVHEEAQRLGRGVLVIPESDLNDVRVITPRDKGGYGLDAQWNDDFHHALHALLTGERDGYYQDFGSIANLKTALCKGFVYSGQYSAYRKRRHGSSSVDRPAQQFVVFSQNHDQVGNRALGERLSSLVSFEQLKLAAAVVLLSPCIPLLFMGEEYAETAPFQYFVDFSDAALIEAVRTGRAEESASSGWKVNVPDPQDEQTFLRSKMHASLRTEGKQAILLAYYSRLLQLRRSVAALSHVDRASMETRGFEQERVLLVRRWHGGSGVLVLYVFGHRETEIPVMVPPGTWANALDSSSTTWGGDGGQSAERILSRGKEIVLRLKPHSVVLYERIREE